MLRCQVLCVAASAALALSLARPGVCEAQGKADPAAEKGDEDDGEEAEAPAKETSRKGKAPAEETEASDEAAADKDAVKDAPAAGPSAKTSGTWIGLRYRAIIIPQFMIGLFAEGGKTLLLHSGGGELALRNGLQEFNFGLWYAGYGMEPTAFKGKSEPVEAWEIAESEMKILYATADFMWGTALTPKLAFNYGVGAGFGFVFGDLKRTQAYPGPGADKATGEGFRPCRAAKEPDPIFCGTDNNHYPPYTEPSWSGGGSKPILMPWLALQTGLRYEFSPKFAGRLDLGFGTSGFFVGVGGNYGL